VHSQKEPFMRLASAAVDPAAATSGRSASYSACLKPDIHGFESSTLITCQRARLICLIVLRIFDLFDAPVRDRP